MHASLDVIPSNGLIHAEFETCRTRDKRDVCGLERVETVPDGDLNV